MTRFQNEGRTWRSGCCPRQISGHRRSRPAFQLSLAGTIGIATLTDSMASHPRWLPGALRDPFAVTVAAEAATWPLMLADHRRRRRVAGYPGGADRLARDAGSGPDCELVPDRSSQVQTEER